MIVTTLRKLGNSQGVILPKPLLAQVGMTNTSETGIEMSVEGGAIVLRPAKTAPREAWAEASRAIAGDPNEGLAWPEFGNDADAGLRW